MLLRPYRDSDLGAILDLHRRQGLNYELPVLDKMALSCVIEEGGNITHAVFLRPTTEIYWLFDQNKEWRRQTLGRMLVLSREIEMAAANEGIEDVHAFIPPTINDRRFELTMTKLGWQKSEWPCYNRRIVAVDHNFDLVLDSEGMAL